MKVVVSSNGRFNAPELAGELLKQGYLEQFFTGYPSWKVDRDLRSYTSTFPWIVMPQMALYRSGMTGIADRLNRPATYTFDQWVARHLPDSDVLTVQSQSGLHSIRRAKQRGIKTVVVRGSSHIVYQDEILAEEYQRHHIPFKRIAPWIVEKELLEYEEADQIEVISTFAYETFLERGISKDKLFIAPLGVDLSLYRPVPKVDSVFRVLYVGTMSLRKGLPYLLEALCGLKLPEFEILLIGSLLDEIKPFLAHYEGSFRHIGVIPRNDLHTYYSQASVFVFPSIEDGFGMVQSQAMACGVPVITTTNTGGRDIITDGVEGFIIPIRSPEAIREKVLYLYHHPEIRASMAEAALRKTQTEGGWGAHANAVIKAYKTLLSDF